MIRWQCMPHWGSVRTNKRALVRYTFIIFVCILTSGCFQVTSTIVINPGHTETPQSIAPLLTTEPSETSALIPTASPTQPASFVWLPPDLPEMFRSAFILPAGYNLTEDPSKAEISLGLGGQNPQKEIQWIYALVAPFPTITDGITTDTLRSAWAGITVSPFNDSPLLMDGSTFNVLSLAWGSPAKGAVQVFPADELLDYAWAHNPSWAIIPFEKLNPRWKVLAVDGQSPVRKDFNSSNYSLTIPFVLSNHLDLGPGNFNLPATNRDANHLTTVAMTGVTAMVRATAFAMENYGVTYPAQDIGPILADADITHISNEIPFSPDCPYPIPRSDSLVFCSNPSYIDLLKEVGTDIVELTGDHFMDYGPEATLYTLQMYDDLDWPYFGGGVNADEARPPILLENNAK